jgi:hypothetical protein
MQLVVAATNQNGLYKKHMLCRENVNKIKMRKIVSPARFDSIKKFVRLAFSFSLAKGYDPLYSSSPLASLDGFSYFPHTATCWILTVTPLVMSFSANRREAFISFHLNSHSSSPLASLDGFSRSHGDSLYVMQIVVAATNQNGLYKMHMFCRKNVNKIKMGHGDRFS